MSLWLDNYSKTIFIAWQHLQKKDKNTYNTYICVYIVFQKCLFLSFFR